MYIYIFNIMHTYKYNMYIYDVYVNVSTMGQHACVAQEDYLCEVALWTEWMHVGTAEAIEEVSLISIDALSFGDLVSKELPWRETWLLAL